MSRFAPWVALLPIRETRRGQTGPDPRLTLLPCPQSTAQRSYRPRDWFVLSAGAALADEARRWIPEAVLAGEAGEVGPSNTLLTHAAMLRQRSAVLYWQKHLLAIEGMEPPAISQLLDLAESYVLLNRSGKTQRDLLRGRTLINLFFEDSTRTRTSFELAGKRLGADVINMSVSTSSVNKGETLIDTAATLNAMQCDLLVVRHDQSGAPNLLAQIVDAAVINAGDGTHEHPTQALLDALTIKRRKGSIGGLVVAICGDIAHSRVARSNIHLLTTMGCQVRVIGPPTLIPTEVAELGVTVFHDMAGGLAGADVVMMLRLQRERMSRGQVPSAREFFRFYGLDGAKLAHAKPDAIVMHPGPMNRGVEIDSAIADDPLRSVIKDQVEMGVAVRMAVLDMLSRGHRRNEP